ncbi:hypothetical protein QSV37_05955 [Acinetobacter sp. VNK23]|uniref:hypothetical protein n=1 Tax=Acinetobacter thutiue TaxID=2998078 RepID=UPI0025769CC8|nr:hypothetical protein [Acinetobacter thutiue]MDM1019850.1 hypothetical protein [Acinetobacter thutiue]
MLVVNFILHIFLIILILLCVKQQNVQEKRKITSEFNQIGRSTYNQIIEKETWLKPQTDKISLPIRQEQFVSDLHRFRTMAKMADIYVIHLNVDKKKINLEQKNVSIKIYDRKWGDMILILHSDVPVSWNFANKVTGLKLLILSGQSASSIHGTFSGGVEGGYYFSTEKDECGGICKKTDIDILNLYSGSIDFKNRVKQVFNKPIDKYIDINQGDLEVTLY